jgi:phenylpropionate dioxygenase-like ring-hydroxylating dioxygenase large terminal subunit
VTAVAEVSVERALERYWHPVCTLDELDVAAPHPLAIVLLGRRLAVAATGDAGAMALGDRCPHRSTRLSVGWVEDGAIRCAYHGWRWAPGGECLEIPSMPETPVPAKACAPAYDAALAYGLVWVRLDPSATTTIPPCPGWDDASMRTLAGAPYTWPTSAPRRVENFVDLAHFAWVHDGTLGRREDPVPDVPEVSRHDGELRFTYAPPDMPVDDEAMFGWSSYRMPMPLTVDIEFLLASGGRRRLWMTASPIDSGSCRSFWFVSRDDDLEPDRLAERDAEHLAFQHLVLAQDEPVVCNQDPPELPLEPGVELSVRTDRVSIEYRRWLRELAITAHERHD